MNSKSPFFILEDFLSPLSCENIIDQCDHGPPDQDEYRRPLKTVRFNRLAEQRLLPALEILFPELEEYYGYEHKGLMPFEIEWFPAKSVPAQPRCENSEFVNNRWKRVNNHDFTGIIFLNSFQPKAPFDPDFEVLGGNLQFPNHGFTINPSRGTLVFFPGDQHFINYTSPIKAGELNQIRFYVAAKKPYIYDKKKFPGDYTTWFKQ